MKVPFVSLAGPTKRVKKQYLEKLSAFLDRGSFILTPEVEEFEKRWASFIGSPYCVGVSSGADALYLAFAVLGVGSGDEVITQGTAYNASVTAILRAGARPRFADIDPDTLTVDVRQIEKLITPKTKAIMPVYLYGQPCDVEKVIAVARKHKLLVIEDCAQAHGATFKGKKVGSFGDAGCFSFYPTKNLGAFGDAGAVTVREKRYVDALRALRNLGQVAKNDHRYLSTNMRLDAVHAIALMLKMQHFEDEIALRQKAAVRYDQMLSAARLPLQPIKLLPDARHVYHLYVVQLLSMDRDELMQKLADKGIGTAVHYPVPVYRQPFYEGAFDPCPVTDTVCSRILSLPLFPDITEREQAYVVDSLKEILHS